MTWNPREKLHDWRKHLTPDEAKIIAASDIAKRALEVLRLEYNKKFQRDRMIIVNRAIQRAKYEERRT
jgi:hypothetical protein